MLVRYSINKCPTCCAPALSLRPQVRSPHDPDAEERRKVIPLVTNWSPEVVVDTCSLHLLFRHRDYTHGMFVS